MYGRIDRLATAISGLPATTSRPIPSRLCEECESSIHPARLQRFPHTTFCARCQEKIGDVPRVSDQPIYQPAYGGFGSETEERDTPTNVVAATRTIPWSDMRPYDDDKGTAKNTGLYVRTKEGNDSVAATNRRTKTKRREN